MGHGRREPKVSEGRVLADKEYFFLEIRIYKISSGVPGDINCLIGLVSMDMVVEGREITWECDSFRWVQRPTSVKWKAVKGEYAADSEYHYYDIVLVMCLPSKQIYVAVTL